MKSPAKQWLNEVMEKRAEARRVRCPHCDHVHLGESNEEPDPDLVSYHGTVFGEGEPYEVECERCEHTFYVHEHVERTYETTKTPAEPEL
jgi:DNA-directed RNA polymerase subunit RPC12/RpoP